MDGDLRKRMMSGADVSFLIQISSFKSDHSVLTIYVSQPMSFIKTYTKRCACLALGTFIILYSLKMEHLRNPSVIQQIISYAL